MSKSTKDTSEETELALEIADEALNSGIPKRDRNGTADSVPQDIIDYLVLESNAPGLNSRIPPFWSRQRDKFLRSTVLLNDGFLIAVYNVLTKIISLIPTVVPLDKEDDNGVFSAKVSNELLRKSWVQEMLMALFDLLTQDNGMHLELLDGTSNPSKPLQPYEVSPGIFIPCVGFKHWDSQRVSRTGDETYPTIVTALNGRDYKVHKTRMISWTDMPSAKTEHYGVGLSAASRIIVNLMQMIESEEIIGDMLFDGLVGEIIFGQPFTSQQLQEAFRKAEQTAADRSQPRYRRFVYVGVDNPAQGQKMEINRIQLRRLPEGYEKASSTTLFMYLMAAALGVDAREIWPATVSGATRADADVQHRKSQNKFTRLWINFMTVALEMKYAPMNTSIDFDFTDAAEELEKAEARKAMAEAHQLELLNGTITREVASEQMHKAGYLTAEQLETVLAFTPEITEAGQARLPGERISVAPDANTNNSGANNNE